MNHTQSVEPSEPVPQPIRHWLKFAGLMLLCAALAIHIALWFCRHIGTVPLAIMAGTALCVVVFAMRNTYQVCRKPVLGMIACLGVPAGLVVLLVFANRHCSLTVVPQAHGGSLVYFTPWLADYSLQFWSGVIAGLALAFLLHFAHKLFRLAN
jgi:hypothetical protein